MAKLKSYISVVCLAASFATTCDLLLPAMLFLHMLLCDVKYMAEPFVILKFNEKCA
jgi:hypothetical protein